MAKQQIWLLLTSAYERPFPEAVAFLLGKKRR